ncbi:MAG: glycine cleavage system protein H [Limisphaerales bacterium]
MQPEKPKTLHYKRSHFATQLPADCLYSPSHFWLARREDGSWRVGFTKFAVRMLGEMVDFGFEVAAGAAVQSGQIIGWIEGFKAISDVFCVADGNFVGANPVLGERITLINQDPYGAGWLYQVEGQPDSKCVEVQGYRQILDKTIDKILEKQKDSEIK